MKHPLLLLGITAIIWSCQQSSQTDSPKASDPQTGIVSDAPREDVTFSVEPNVFKLSHLPDSVQAKISNHTTDTLVTGVGYHIEMLEDDRWSVVSPERGFIAVGILLLPASDKLFTKQLLKDEIPYKVGKYRLVKYYVREDFQQTREQSFLYAPFTIE